MATTQQENKPRPIPVKVLQIAEGKLKKLRSVKLSLQVTDDNVSATVLNGQQIVGGPFMHGQTLQGFVDGFTQGEGFGFSSGRDKGLKEGYKEANKVGGMQEVYVLKTGTLFHGYYLVEGAWKKLDDQRLPCYSMGKCLDVLIECLHLKEFLVKFVDKTDEVYGPKSQQNPT